MNRVALLSALVVAAALAGCGKPIPVDATANETANTPLVMPPSIAASKTYRCKDNSLAYVDYLSDGKTVTVRDTPEATPTALTMMEPGKPFTAEGYALTGTPTGASVALTRPGKGSQSCHV
jgi:hypothetical protein